MVKSLDWIISAACGRSRTLAEIHWYRAAARVSIKLGTAVETDDKPRLPRIVCDLIETDYWSYYCLAWGDV